MSWGGVGTFQPKKGSATQRRSAPLCIASTSKSHDLNMKLSVPKRRFRTLFVLQYSLSLHYSYRRWRHAAGCDPSKTTWALYIPNNIYWHFDGATLPKHLLACATDGQKSALTSHSRSISTFYMTAYVVVIYWEWSHRLLANFTATCFFFLPWLNSQTMHISIFSLVV